MRRIRFDNGEMARPEKTLQGFLRAPCFATRSGIFLYKNDDGSTRRELRPPEEVFSPASLATLAGVPVTDEHPPVAVDASNAREFARGFTGESVEGENNFVKTSVTITDADLIKAIENREKVETSCGYSCDLDESPGEWNGEAYDAIQKNIRYNHLAVVSRGRAGPAVRIRLDAGAAVQTEQNQEGEFCMTKIRVDGVELEVSEPVALALTAKFKKDEETGTASGSKMAELQAEIDNLKGMLAAKEIEMDACKTDMVAVKAEAEANKMDSAKIHSLVTARLDLCKKAEKFIDASIKLDSMSEREIKVETIKAKMADFDAKDRSDSYVDGLFEGIVSLAPAVRTDALASTVAAVKNDGAASTAADARKRSMEADRNAYKAKK
jgi:hypothetical protein